MWQVLAGYLMFGTVAGIMMALFLDNVGGAWDNAKKYVEVRWDVTSPTFFILSVELLPRRWKAVEEAEHRGRFGG